MPSRTAAAPWRQRKPPGSTGVWHQSMSVGPVPAAAGGDRGVAGAVVCLQAKGKVSNEGARGGEGVAAGGVELRYSALVKLLNTLQAHLLLLFQVILNCFSDTSSIKWQSQRSSNGFSFTIILYIHTSISRIQSICRAACQIFSLGIFYLLF